MRRTPVAIAIALPLLLALAVAAIAITVRARGLDGSAPPPPETGPVALAPVDAPAASDPRCSTLLAALDGGLPSEGTMLPVRPIAPPVPPGVRAWAASPQPVVLRCGLPRPAELTPTSELLEVDGVRFLRLDDGLPQPQLVTYVAVDRPVYVALTEPAALSSGPLQQVADVIRAQLPATPVAVR